MIRHSIHAYCDACDFSETIELPIVLGLLEGILRGLRFRHGRTNCHGMLFCKGATRTELIERLETLPEVPSAKAAQEKTHQA